MPNACSIRVLLLAAAVTFSAGSMAQAGWSLSTPGPLAATPAAAEVALAWTNISGETGFVIERRVTGSASFAEIAKLGTDVTRYKDVVTNTGQFEYRVRAYKARGGKMYYSPYTNTAYSALPCG